MITHELLIMAIKERYPGIVHGKDFWVAHPLDARGQQCGDAFIASWAAGPAPDVAPFLIRAVELRPAIAARDARERRDDLLAGSDWTQLGDVPEATRIKWTTYRQALRDVPQQPGWPEAVTWPVAPGAGATDSQVIASAG
ncbi:tail fiber assembly protein [Burkholderia stagnalis]|uniref:tail fiber assembly protein n=1 Tax=Burkholderia stagnalis TaxID=1503054 RepID=UPI0009BEE6A7|nr:tail fiber assembly protein [Burkholderia stagnalis]